MSGDHPHVALTRNGIRIDTDSSNFGYVTVSKLHLLTYISTACSIY